MNERKAGLLFLSTCTATYRRLATRLLFFLRVLPFCFLCRFRSTAATTTGCLIFAIAASAAAAVIAVVFLACRLSLLLQLFPRLRAVSDFNQKDSCDIHVRRRSRGVLFPVRQANGPGPTLAREFDFDYQVTVARAA